MNVYKALIACCCLCISVGCNSSHTTADIQKVVGHPLDIPHGMSAHIFDRDTVVNIDTSALKLVVYYNFHGCASCKLKELLFWDDYVTELDSIAPQVEQVFIMNVGHAEDKTNMDLVTYRFDHPVFYDRTGEFEALNLLPENPMLHTFLLDGSNKVVLVGSPINNSRMWDLYKSTISTLVAEQGQAVSAN